MQDFEFWMISLQVRAQRRRKNKEDTIIDLFLAVAKKDSQERVPGKKAQRHQKTKKKCKNMS
jgi:hypothetical protein